MIMTVLCLTHGRYALIDDEDWAFVNQWNWFAEEIQPGCWYVNRKTYLGKRENLSGSKERHKRYHYGRISLHRLLTRAAPNQKVDHVDRNPLNNQRSNLRIATCSQNNANRGLPKNNKTGFKGIWWNPARKLWLSALRFQGHTKHCGYFANMLDAARAYDRKALELFGEFALTNEKMGLFEKYKEVHH